MKKINVLAVCGSGTVSSAMVGMRIKKLLSEHGYEASIEEINPGMLKGKVSNGNIDLIAYTSPIVANDAPGIPQVNAVGVLTGMDEETFLEEALEALGKSE